MNTQSISSEQILLYYLYIAIPNPHEIARWQRELCTQLGLTGRIILAEEGINGTLGGTADATNAYITAMHNHPLFSAVVFKTSTGGSRHFPRLSIKVRDEIVALGIDPKKLTTQDGGIHLSPQETHELLNRKPENLVIIDCRNEYESEIGRFEGALRPKTTTFREFPEYVDTHKKELDGKQVLMYCTGGVRCERASAYLKQQGIDTVYQIDGGIHNYVTQYPNGHFRGKLYVFDDRVAVPINDDILSTCIRCKTAADSSTNCAFTHCNAQCVLCTSCSEISLNTCSESCKEKILQNPEKRRQIWRSELDKTKKELCRQ